MDYKVIIAIIDLVLDVYIKNYEQVMTYKSKFNNYQNRYNRRKRY